MSMSLRSGRKVVYNPTLSKTRMHCFPSAVETRIEKLENLNQFMSECDVEVKNLLKSIRERVRERVQTQVPARKQEFTLADLRMRLQKLMMRQFTSKTTAVLIKPENMLNFIAMDTLCSESGPEVLHTTRVYFDGNDGNNQMYVYADLELTIERTKGGAMFKITPYVDTDDIASNDNNSSMLRMLNQRKTELEQIINTSQSMLEVRYRIRAFNKTHTTYR